LCLLLKYIQETFEMSRKKNRSRKRGRGGRGVGTFLGPAWGAHAQDAESAMISFTRAPSMYGTAQNKQLIRAVLEQTTVLTTNGAGICAPVVTLDVQNFSLSAQLTGFFDEWRMIGARCQYFPYSSVPTATLTAGGECVLSIDRDSNSGLVSFLQGLRQGGSSFNPFEKSKVMTYQMLDASEASFSGALTGNSAAWFKVYGSGLANTQSYGVLITQSLWEFRGNF